jgi:hypothetical protein
LDLVWVDEGRTSGTTVGEFDGVVRPSLGAMGGLWVNRWFGFSVGLGVAQRATLSFVDEVEVRQRTAVVRPSLDLPRSAKSPHGIRGRRTGAQPAFDASRRHQAKH